MQAYQYLQKKKSYSKSKFQINDKNLLAVQNNFKDVPTNNVNEVTPIIIQTDNNISKDFTSKDISNFRYKIKNNGI